MLGPTSQLLRQFDSLLLTQFQTLREQRGDAPVFLIEHGLEPEQLTEMMRLVGGRARIEGLLATRWIKCSLPLAVTITETGYGYRGTGTEFWPRLSRDLGVPISAAERLAVRALFERLNQRLGTPRPHDSDWARNYSNIAWPIRNALAPLEIHRPLATALGRLAQSGAPGSDDEFYRRLVSIAGGLWSGRLSDWLEDRTLAIGLGRGLLSGESADAWLEPQALARIGRDIRMDAECRQALRQARRTLRTPASKAAVLPPPATWLASVSVRDGVAIPQLDGILLQGPHAGNGGDEGNTGQGLLLTIAGQSQGPLLLQDFLEGAVVEVSDTARAFATGLLRFSGRQDRTALLAALTPSAPSLFRWVASGGILSALNRDDQVGPSDQVLQVTLDRPDSPAKPVGALDLSCPVGILGWVADASDCRSALAAAGVRLSTSQLAEFTSAGRMMQSGTSLLPPADMPLFLRALCPGLMVSLGKPGALAMTQAAVMGVGDVAILPAQDYTVTLHLQAGSQTETWNITPQIEYPTSPRAFTCEIQPPRPGLFDLQSGLLVLTFISPVALGPATLQLGLTRNGAELARMDLTLSGLPARLAFAAPALEPLRAAAYQAPASEDAWWSLTAKISGLGEFAFPLRRRQDALDRVPGQIGWRSAERESDAENGAENALISPRLSARALAPLLGLGVASQDGASDDIRLWLPDVQGLPALRGGLIDGKVSLFGQSSRPNTLEVARRLAPAGEKHGLDTVCEALIAWHSAGVSSFLADARRQEIVAFLEDTLVLSLCGETWLEAEVRDRHRPRNLAREMAEGAVRDRLAGGPDFPQVAPEDLPYLHEAMARRFADALHASQISEKTPAHPLTEDEAALFDIAVDAAYADLSALLEQRGNAPLEESYAGNPADRWQWLAGRSWTRQMQSPFRHLILPEARWETLQATSYGSLSDDDLVSLLTRCHLDISRTRGIDWVGPQVLRSGLMLWLAPAQLPETEAWREHLARLLSDRHTARAIRYVALRLRQAEGASVTSAAIGEHASHD